MLDQWWTKVCFCPPPPVKPLLLWWCTQFFQFGILELPQRNQHPRVQLFLAPVCVWQAVCHILVPHPTCLSDSEWNIFVNLTWAAGQGLCVAQQNCKHRSSKAIRHIDLRTQSYRSMLETQLLFSFILSVSGLWLSIVFYCVFNSEPEKACRCLHFQRLS